MPVRGFLAVLVTADQRGNFAPDADRRTPDQLPGPGDADEETADHEDRDRVHVSGVTRVGDHVDALGQLDDEYDGQPDQEQGITDGDPPHLAEAD